MKKILFASTALVAASLFGIDAAQAADPIKISVGGFSKWWVVGASQSGDYTGALTSAKAAYPSSTAGAYAIGGTSSYNTADVKGDNEIHFKGETALDNGLKVGVFVSLEAGGNGDQTTDPIDQSYAWVEGGFGKVMLGTLKNGAALLHVQAPDAASNWGDGGIVTGNYAVARPAAVEGLNQRVGFSSATNTTAIITDNKAEKITYVTPVFAGLTLGATYVPDATTEDNRGQGTSQAQAYGVGAGYARSVGPVGVKLSGGFVHSILGQREQLFQYSSGAQLSYAGFTLGGSYQLARDAIGGSGASPTTGTGQNGSSSVNNNPLGGATSILRAALGSTATGYKYDYGGQGYDVGLQYATGPYALSFAYFHSETEGLKSATGTFADLSSYGNDTMDFYQFSGKYSLSPGIDLLTSVGYAEYKSGAYGHANEQYKDLLKNDGYYGMTGLALKF